MAATYQPFKAKSLSPPGFWLPVVAHSVLGLLLAGAAIVLLRRIVIQQWSPAPLLVALVVAVTVTALAMAVRWFAGSAVPTWLPTIAIAAWAIACSLPGSQLPAVLIWVVAIAADICLLRVMAPAADHRAAPPIPQQSDSKAFEELSKSLVAEPTEGTSTDAPLEDGETVLQQVMRVRDADGREYVYATLRGELEAGERRTTLFVGFCPPFQSPPLVEAEVIEGPPGMAKVIQSLHNGAQIEVDLDEAPSEDAYVTVEAAAFENNQ